MPGLLLVRLRWQAAGMSHARDTMGDMSDTIQEPTPPRRVRDVVLNLRVTTTAKNTVQELADREGRTLSDMGRILLQKGLNQHVKERKS